MEISKEEVLQELLHDISAVMEDLYQSGFDTVHEVTLKELKKVSELAAQYGMEYLQGMLYKLYECAKVRNHQITKDNSAMADVFTKINAYLYICRQKAIYDCGEVYYSKVMEVEND